MDVSTQLRLLNKTEHPARPLRGRAMTARRPTNRRAVHWESQWRLDERTRRIGQAGVASARAALSRANPEDADEQPGADTGLRRAS